jgi:hypothetical protein
MRVLSMLGGLALSALTIGPQTARAQDLAAEYAAAADVFGIAGDYVPGEGGMAQAMDRARDVEGTWLSVMLIMNTFGVVRDPALLAATVEKLGEYCQGSRQVANQIGPRSFELRTFNQAGDTGFAVNYQFVGGRSYQRSVDEKGLLTRLGLAPEEAALGIYADRGLAGYVEVFLPSPNVLVIQPFGVSAEIYLRCPAS